jgi:hypothetical protein
MFYLPDAIVEEITIFYIVLLKLLTFSVRKKVQDLSTV